MNLQIEFAPFLSWPSIGVFAALCLAAIMFMIWRRRRGTVLRAITAALLLACLANPIIRQDEREPLTDIAVVIVDQSESQSIGQRTPQTQKALSDLKSRIASLGNTELRAVNVSSSLDEANDGTRLFTALGHAVSDIPKDRFAGAFLITDGQVHDVPENLSGLPTPIHSLISGSKSESDRRIVLDRSPRFGIVGQDQTIQFHVEESNGDKSPITVAIQIPGGAPTNIVITPGVVTDWPVKIDHAGQNFVELSAAIREGELSKENNRTVAAIDGIRDRLRVLLISGQPHPGERTWRDLLKADASVDLVHFTILRPPEKQDATPTKELSLIAFPTRELFVDKLDQFDLVIFDRYRRQAILPDAYMANIAEYVKKGGAVLVASGPDFAESDGLYATPLADVLSAAPTGLVTETPFQPALTEQGKRHPVTRDLPSAGGGKPSWGRWFRLIDATTTADAETLMSGPDNKPLLVLAHQGEGRVAQLLSDHGWLWARGFEGGGPQTELLRRMAHWLMKEPDLEEEKLSAKQSAGNLIISRQTLADKTAPVTLTSPSGKTQTIELKPDGAGHFTATVPVTEAGLHTLSDGKLLAAAAVGTGDAKEASDIRATTDKLQPVATATGGGIVWIEDGMPAIGKSSATRLMAGSGWMNIRDNGQFRVTAIHQISLFSTLLSLALLLIAASAMWFREGR
jgi:hypothetical protein